MPARLDGVFANSLLSKYQQGILLFDFCVQAIINLFTTIYVIAIYHLFAARSTRPVSVRVCVCVCMVCVNVVAIYTSALYRSCIYYYDDDDNDVVCSVRFKVKN